MSSHTSSHDHGSRGDSIFATAKNWFASKSPSHKNSLSSIDATGNNLVKGLVKSTTGWFADILNPLGTAAMNGVSLFSPSKYREHGWKNIPKSISGIVSHVVDSANNLIAGSTFRGLDHMYTHGVTDSLVDITSGTTDRIPGVGKFAGNVVK